MGRNSIKSNVRTSAMEEIFLIVTIGWNECKIFLMNSAVSIIVESFLAAGATPVRVDKLIVGSRFGNQVIEIHYLRFNGRFIKIYDSIEDGFSLLFTGPNGDLSENTDWYSHSPSLPDFNFLTLEQKTHWATSVVRELVQLMIQ